MSATLAALAGIGAGVKFGLDYFSSKEAMKTQQKYYQQNQKQQFENEKALIAQSPLLQKQGMIQAGFSPTALAGASLGTPNAPSAPMGEAVPAHSTTLSDIAGLASLENQNKVAEAQSKLLSAQAEEQEIQNKRLTHEDDQFVNELKQQLQNQIQFYESQGLDASGLQQQYDNLVNNPDFNLGDFWGSMRAIEVHNKSQDAFTHRVEELVRQQTELHKLNNNVASDVAQMPELARELQEKLIALKMQETYYMSSSGDLNKQKLENLAVDIKKVYAEIDNLVKDGKLKQAEADKIRNSDIATLLIDGEYGKALVSTGVEVGKDLSKAGAFMLGSKNIGGALGQLANMGKAKRYLSSLKPNHPLNKVQDKLKKSVGEKRADALVEMWFSQQIHRNSKGLPTISYEEFLKEHAKSVKFMRGY